LLESNIFLFHHTCKVGTGYRLSASYKRFKTKQIPGNCDRYLLDLLIAAYHELYGNDRKE
jgi:hypothetical protein